MINITIIGPSINKLQASGFLVSAAKGLLDEMLTNWGSIHTLFVINNMYVFSYNNDWLSL